MEANNKINEPRQQRQSVVAVPCGGAAQASRIIPRQAISKIDSIIDPGKCHLGVFNAQQTGSATVGRPRYLEKGRSFLNLDASYFV